MANGGILLFRINLNTKTTNYSIFQSVSKLYFSFLLFSSIDYFVTFMGPGICFDQHVHRRLKIVFIVATTGKNLVFRVQLCFQLLCLQTAKQTADLD